MQFKESDAYSDFLAEQVVILRERRRDRFNDALNGLHVSTQIDGITAVTAQITRLMELIHMVEHFG